jgi:hydrogenase maturation protein HypF
MDRSVARVAVRVRGTVQGVGFRPFVYGLAIRHGLKGFVRNDGGDVYIEVEGRETAIAAFVEGLSSEAPPLSRVRAVTVEPLGPARARQAEQDFRVIESRTVPGGEPGISADVSLCRKCRREIADPGDRRYLYPFINCTDCGPRFTIVEDTPYDRGNTSMKGFVMCRDCAREYCDPGDRRFHAEPDACWECGPVVQVCEPRDVPVSGATLPFPLTRAGRDRQEWIREAQGALRRGEILAIKGVGGFHLACDALSSFPVEELRRRKRRPARPFAIMVKDVETVLDWFSVSPEERQLLESPASPIVILEAKHRCPVTPAVAPGLDHLGVMLPYSPLHTLLFHSLSGSDAPSPALVMTSGNATGMPLAYQVDAAKRELGPIADRFVIHNRRIVRTCDDSVVRVVLDKPLFYRRSRGYVPADFELRGETGQDRRAASVLAAGAEGKNTFCLLRGSRARLSQHAGDVHNEESLARYKTLVEDFTRLYKFSPDALAVDMHPGYEVSRVAREAFPGVPVFEVQHHHAHMVAAMAEHGVAGPCVGIILDGTGYGPDGRVWGGELLYGDCASFERVGRLREVAMPGGEKAILEPWRMAVAYVKAIYGDAGLEIARSRLPDQAGKLEPLFRVADWEGHPRTSSAGRLFDAVSALLGLSSASTYEGESASVLGEAALRLVARERQRTGRVAGGVKAEAPSRGGEARSTPGGGESVIDTFPLVSWVVESAMGVAPVGLLAYEFHRRLAFMLASRACEVAAAKGVRQVVLSGGVYQNPLFLRLAAGCVEDAGFTPLWPQVFPPNDGGISLGQAVVARRMAAK